MCGKRVELGDFGQLWATENRTAAQAKSKIRPCNSRRSAQSRDVTKPTLGSQQLTQTLNPLRKLESKEAEIISKLKDHISKEWSDQNRGGRVNAVQPRCFVLWAWLSFPNRAAFARLSERSALRVFTAR